MFFQRYLIYLNDNTVFEVYEPYELPWEKSFFRMYEKAKDNSAVTASLRDGTEICVLKKNIKYIRMISVEKVW